MSHDNIEPTFNGAKANQGTIDLRYPDAPEGYAILKCGGTEVKIPYTLLNGISLRVGQHTTQFAGMCSLSKAINSITCEASLGHIPKELL